MFRSRNPHVAPTTLIRPREYGGFVVKTEPRSLGRIVGETIFIVLAAAALLAWLGLLVWAGFLR